MAGVDLPPEPAAEVRLAPSAAKGVLGAWLLAGPFRANKPALDRIPIGLAGDDRRLSATANAAVGAPRDFGKTRGVARWTLATAVSGDPGLEGSRAIDLKSTLSAQGSDLIAYAAGTLHLERAERVLLLLGVDDGVRVSVDGNVVYTRDDARPVRDDDDIIPLDLAAGDHDVLLKFHQRDGAWAFRARIVDRALAPPVGAWLTLPGTTAEDARALAARMSWLVVDRAFDPASSRYRPSLVVRYPEGAPRGVPLPVTIRASGTFDLNAGGAVMTDGGVRDLVVSLPPLDPWTGTLALETTIAGRVVKSSIVARPASERALVRIERALSGLRREETWLLPGSLDSVRFLSRRLARLVARGDADTEAQAAEAAELERLAANLERGLDPYTGATGMMRRAITSVFDGAPSEFGLYVPPSYKPGDGRKLPLIVGLHGMNSYPLSMMRALFGLDEERKESAWKDRHLPPAPPIDAIVITPNAHFNTMYREVGEDDVLEVMSWARSVFPIDETRISVTGPSMGGIGSASLPFHYPHVFAGSAPLCGYHSYLIRPDLQRPKRPWERALLEERSNVLWAENGEHLPLWIVHGTRDLPEANSGVLIERYEKLRYPIKHDHPDAGHNVWGITYADLKGMRWLASQRLDPHPTHVRFRTLRSRYATSAWVTVNELEAELAWGDVDARVKSRNTITVTTSGVRGIAFDRNPSLLDAGAIRVSTDGTTLDFAAGEPLVVHRRGAAWEKGPGEPPSPDRPEKRGRVTGPLRDVFHEPLLFVWADDEEGRANERVARFFANPPGFSVAYPVMSDAEFFAQREALANDRALFLVGRGNKVLAALAGLTTARPLPLRVQEGAVTIGAMRVTGREVGAAFVHPNPARSDRYVVVVAGADVEGMLRAMSLPDLLPDFVVWDSAVARGRGQILLGSGTFRAAGFFDKRWALPASLADPLAKSPPPAPESEREATPYLP